jgi:hypothetical protein
MAVSQSAFERSLMQKNFMMMVGTSLSTLLVLNWDGLGRLGFYVEAAPQVFSLLISYAFVKILILVAVPAAKYVLARHVKAPKALVQTELNACFEGHPFNYAINAAAILYAARSRSSARSSAVSHRCARSRNAVTGTSSRSPPPSRRCCPSRSCCARSRCWRATPSSGTCSSVCTRSRPTTTPS